MSRLAEVGPWITEQWRGFPRWERGLWVWLGVSVVLALFAAPTLRAVAPGAAVRAASWEAMGSRDECGIRNLDPEARDPWGSAWEEGQRPAAGGSEPLLRSAGPDRSWETADDVTVAVYDATLTERMLVGGLPWFVLLAGLVPVWLVRLSPARSPRTTPLKEVGIVAIVACPLIVMVGKPVALLAIFAEIDGLAVPGDLSPASPLLGLLGTVLLVCVMLALGTRQWLRGPRAEPDAES